MDDFRSQSPRQHLFLGSGRVILSLGLKVTKTPYRTPQANSFCERLIGTVRRECMDFIIPLHEAHIHQILKEWTDHYNRPKMVEVR